MYGDQFGEVVCGYWGLKGWYFLVKTSILWVVDVNWMYFVCLNKGGIKLI